MVLLFIPILEPILLQILVIILSISLVPIEVFPRNVDNLDQLLEEISSPNIAIGMMNKNEDPDVIVRNVRHLQPLLPDVYGLWIVDSSDDGYAEGLRARLRREGLRDGTHYSFFFPSARARSNGKALQMKEFAEMCLREGVKSCYTDGDFEDIPIGDTGRVYTILNLVAGMLWGYRQWLEKHHDSSLKPILVKANYRRPPLSGTNSEGLTEEQFYNPRRYGRVGRVGTYVKKELERLGIFIASIQNPTSGEVIIPDVELALYGRDGIHGFFGCNGYQIELSMLLVAEYLGRFHDCCVVEPFVGWHDHKHQEREGIERMRSQILDMIREFVRSKLQPIESYGPLQHLSVPAYG